MIYFDNASTSNFKPFCVKYAMFKYNTKMHTANPNRSGHFLSTDLGRKIYNARKSFADCFGIQNPSDVIFTSGCTEALNLAIFGTVRYGGHIITTANEHNSVLRPLKKLADDKKIELTIITPKGYEITADEIKKHIKKNTYMVITVHRSNVLGCTCDVKSIGKLCKRYNLLYLVDGAQSVGHIKINMVKDNISMLALAGHKGLHGPAGVGALLINGFVPLKPLKYGGTGTNSSSVVQGNNIPEDMEAGTCQYPNILAFEQGLLYTYKNFDAINSKIAELSTYLIKKLCELKGVILIGNKDNKSGVVTISFKSVTASEVSTYMNEMHKICVRTGVFCAPLIQNKYKQKNGYLRISLDFKNKKSQIDFFIKKLKNLLNLAK